MPRTRSQSKAFSPQEQGASKSASAGEIFGALDRKKRVGTSAVPASHKRSKETAAVAAAPAAAMVSALTESPIEFITHYTAPASICTNKSLDQAMMSVSLQQFRKSCSPTTSTECSICQCSLEHNIVATTACQHYYHRECLQQALHHGGTQCPMCRQSLIPAPQGKCPSATMRTHLISNPCREKNMTKTIVQIDYTIPSGTQSAFHDHPGQRFVGTHRTAFLLHTPESLRLLRRLRYAFEHGLTFTVGTSLTTGRRDCVTWASIHHKTGLGRGPFSLPDEGYVFNCNEELDHLHVPAAEDC